MDVWEKQFDEPQEKYELFIEYLDAKILSKVASESGNELSTVKGWAKKYDWDDRAEAFYRNEEKEAKIQRANNIKESAYNYIDDLQKQMSALSLTTSLYHKALKDGGMKEMEKLSVLEKRALSIEDNEIKLKTLKQYKEILELTSEGREMLKHTESSGKVVINITPANLNPVDNAIEITPSKIEIELNEE